MDFARPFADPADAHLAVPALEREVLGHSVPAVDLDRPVDDPAGAFGGQELGHRRLRAERLAPLRLARRCQGRPAGRSDIDLVVDHHPLDRLAGGERSAEGLPLLGVVDAHRLGGDRDADTTGGIRDALARQPVVGDREALADLAQHIGVGHAGVLELQFGPIVARPQSVDHAAHVEPGRVGIDYEAGDAAAALRGIGAGEDDAEVGPIGAGDEDLRAGDQPVIAVADRPGADRPRRVGAARGFGKAEEAALFTAQHREQVALLLIVVGLVELRQARAAEGAEARRIESGAMLRGFDGDQGLGDDVDVRTAEFWRNSQAIKSHPADDLDQPRLIIRLESGRVRVELGFQWDHLLAHETAHLVDDQGLLWAHFEVHGVLRQPGVRRPIRRRASAPLPAGSAPKSAL